MKALGSTPIDGDHGKGRVALLRVGFKRIGIVLLPLGACLGMWYWLNHEPNRPQGKARLWYDAGSRYPPEPAPETRLRTSQYVTMRDGVKLAIDLYLPKGLAPGKRLPTLLCQTRYYRGAELRWPFSRFMSPPQTLYPEFFIDNGYAFVAVDTRGTGASYGN